jgi:hypothetical protein
MPFPILREDGPHLAASKIDNNLNLSTGRLENAQAIHLFTISSFIGWSASNEDVDDDAFFLLGYCLQLFINSSFVDYFYVLIFEQSITKMYKAELALSHLDPPSSWV